MRRAVVVLLVLVVLVCTSAAAPLAGAPPTCGATVTGYVRLVADLTCTTDVGLHLTGTGTLDLAGHTIRQAHPGAPSTSGGSTVALLYDEEARFTIRNARISGWGDGVVLATDDNESIELARLEPMVFTDNGAAVYAYYGDVEVRTSVFRATTSRSEPSGATRGSRTACSWRTATPCMASSGSGRSHDPSSSGASTP